MAHPHHPDAVRTLHPLVLPARLHDPLPGEQLLRGLYIDTGTTGFDPQRDDIIELALLPFSYTDGGQIVDVFHDAAQVHRNDPQRAVAPQIVALTDLTNDGARGALVHVRAASALVAAADLIVAHNAAFDRPFVERVIPAARSASWACSQREVPWAEAGFPSAALACLACAYGVYPRARHRALVDCEVGVWLLASPLPHTGQPVLAALLERALRETVRLWAVRAPFEARGVLKRRGYRWMPEGYQNIPRSWWTEVAPEREDDEIEWLARHVYRAFGANAPVPDALPRRRITAVDRWRSEPPDARLSVQGGATCRGPLH